MGIGSAMGSAMRRGREKAVVDSPDLQRIVKLKRRKYQDFSAEVTELLKLPCGTMTLREAQARALLEAYEQRGLLAPIRVGGGKTLITLLLATILEADKTVLMVPSALRERTYEEINEMRKHWEIRVPHVLGYETLGHPHHADDLANFKPDLIVADECHRLRFRSSAVTRRVERYIRAAPETVFCGLSGTAQGEKLESYRHLAMWALGKNSPLPLDIEVVKTWDQALNPDHGSAPTDVGALAKHFGRDYTNAALGKWIRDTPGVVSTKAVGCKASIEISRWDAPEVCVDEIRNVMAQDERPDGTPLTPPESVDVRCQLALGFWYRWDPLPPEHWMNARRDWCRFVREVLEDEDNDTWDSESQVAAAHPREAAHWLAVKPSFKIQTSPVWLDHAVMTEAIRATAEHPTIVWSKYRAVGECLGKLMQHYGKNGRSQAGQHIEKDPGTGTISASMRSCGVGMNLQQFNRNLLLCPSPNAELLEQLIGRTHREGQRADTIRMRWIRSRAVPYHTEALRRARDSAAILEAQNQEPQKLSAATYLK